MLEVVSCQVVDRDTEELTIRQHFGKRVEEKIQAVANDLQVTARPSNDITSFMHESRSGITPRITAQDRVSSTDELLSQLSAVELSKPMRVDLSGTTLTDAGLQHLQSHGDLIEAFSSVSGEPEISLEYMRKGKVVTASVNPGDVIQELRQSTLPPEGTDISRSMKPSKTYAVTLKRAVLKGILKGDTLKDVRGVTYMKGGRQLGIRLKTT